MYTYLCAHDVHTPTNRYIYTYKHTYIHTYITEIQYPGFGMATQRMFSPMTSGTSSGTSSGDAVCCGAAALAICGAWGSRPMSRRRAARSASSHCTIAIGSCAGAAAHGPIFASGAIAAGRGSGRTGTPRVASKLGRLERSPSNCPNVLAISATVEVMR